MKVYFMRVVGLSLLSFVADALISSSGREGTRRAVRLVISLCMAAAVILPLGRALSGENVPDLRDLIPGEATEEDGYGALAEEKWGAYCDAQLRQSVQTVLAEQCGISGDCYELTFGYDASGAPETIWIRLFGAGLLHDPRGVEAMLGQAFEIPCYVVAG